MHLYGTQSVNNLGHLTIGGVDTVDLAHIYGTPLLVYDIALFKERAVAFKETFAKGWHQSTSSICKQSFFFHSHL